MADLTLTEKRALEKWLQMDASNWRGAGYVLDFSNRTLAEFVMDSTGLDIYDTRYDSASGSKANRMRAFWKQEPNHVVGKLLTDLLQYSRPTTGDDPDRDRLFRECERIAARLTQSALVEAIGAIVPEGNEWDFEVLARAVRDSIERNEPEAGLDRLHTYVTKLVRTLSKKRGIVANKDKPLHSLFGEYIKALRNAGLIESEMTERILKTSISILESFNGVRNDRSLAHDNPMLNYEEGLLIYNYVCSSVRFIRALEGRCGTGSAAI